MSVKRGYSMAMNLEQKKARVASLEAIATSSISAIAADYCLNASDAVSLRNQARENGVVAIVSRCTLAKRALKDTDFSCLEPALKGQTMLFFSKEEPGAAAKLVKSFMKGSEALSVKALAMDGVLMGPEKLEAIASLPSRDEALAKLAYVLKAPLTKFVRTVKEPIAQGARAFAAVRDQKQQ